MQASTYVVMQLGRLTDMLRRARGGQGRQTVARRWPGGMCRLKPAAAAASEALAPPPRTAGPPEQRLTPQGARPVARHHSVLHHLRVCGASECERVRRQAGVRQGLGWGRQAQLATADAGPKHTGPSVKRVALNALNLP